jgi:hypothetical protein
VREFEGGVSAGIILTRKPEVPPLVFLVCRFRSNGPVLDVLDPLSARSLPANSTEPFAELLGLAVLAGPEAEDERFVEDWLPPRVSSSSID